MKTGFCKLTFITMLSLSFHAKANDFDGAKVEPIGKTKGSVAQLRVTFPEAMAKKEAFTVACKPAVEGYGSWADNNTMWTYNFKESQDGDSRLAGGTKCEVTQTAELQAAEGNNTWPAGKLNYSVSISGPNVNYIYPAYGFDGSLRETDPVVLIEFDGPVNREKFFADQNAFISYQSENAAGEKLPLVPVPADKVADLFKHFKSSNGLSITPEGRNWVIATLRQNLISGAKVNLTVQNQTSAENPDVKAEEVAKREFEVRSRFQAEISCASPANRANTCLPNSSITVKLNGKVKWADVKDTYIEYIPFKSKKVVRSYPKPEKNEDDGLFDRAMNFLGSYVSYFAKFSDSLVERVTFDVKIEPETQAKVALPRGLQDIDGRALANPIPEFFLRIAAMNEEITVPRPVSFFEKEQPKAFMPVGVINQNQKLLIRKSGQARGAWAPVRDMAQIIRLLRAYDSLGDYRSEPEYTSPLESLNVPNNRTEMRLTGTKNRETFLKFEFGRSAGKTAGGLYAIEISSPSLDKEQNSEENYVNPRHVLAQVTDLAVHLKKGDKQTLAWVTRLSDGRPVAAAAVEIYNCQGAKVLSLTADNNGVARFDNQTWATDCGEERSSYAYASEFFAVARSGQDFTFTHTSWYSSNSYAYSAPGVDYVSSNVTDNQVYFHSIVGVNLVKPGQTVPVQILAKLPQSRGFRDVPAAQLPTTARIVNVDDSDVYYDFPLTWQNGQATLTWTVPAGSSAKLGMYAIQITPPGQKWAQSVNHGDIEVAEFKVPLMTAILSLPTQALVKPAAIPAQTSISYANGVGAQDLPTEISYYFEPTSVGIEKLEGYSFGSGPVALKSQEINPTENILPGSSRPARIEGLKTDASGNLTVDLGQQDARDGRKIAEVIGTLDRPQQLIVRARYQDQMGEYQTLSQGKVIYNSQTYVGTQVVSGSRAEARLNAAAVDVNQNIITDLSDLEIKVVRVETKVIGEEIFGGVIKNTVERELKSVNWTPNCALQDKVAVCRVGALQEGTYAFQATAKSSQQAANTVFKVDTDGRVYNDGEYYYFGDDEERRQLPLALNKEMYRDGETAVVSFAAPFKTCSILVTVERSDVMESYTFPNACERGKVEVPVSADMAPNAYVSVYAVTGRAKSAAVQPGQKDFGRPTYKLGFANLKVDWSRFKSNVQVRTDKPKYEPGENVTVTVNVGADQGALTAGTVTLIAVEEKILELKKNDSYALLGALMQQRGHSVSTLTALEMIETVNSADQLRQSAPRKDGDEGGDGNSKSEFARKLFDALVTFQPNVPVVNGVATVSFKANDSLTRFKVIAVAMDNSQKFGLGDVVYLSQKDTQGNSNIPPVAHTGDRYPVIVNVQNNGADAKTYRVVVEIVVRDADGNIVSRKTLTKEQAIDPNKASSIDVGQIEVADNAHRVEHTIRIYDGQKLVDAIEPAPQIVMPSVPTAVRDSYLVQIENGRFRKELVKDDAALADRGEIRVGLAKSLVGGAIEQMKARVEKDVFADFFIESRFYSAIIKQSESELRSAYEAILASTDGEGFTKYYSRAPRGSLYLTANLINAIEGDALAKRLLPPALNAKWQSAVSKVLTKSVSPAYLDGKASPMIWLRAQSLMGRAAFVLNEPTLIDNAKSVSESLSNELAAKPDAFGQTVDKWSSSDLLDFWLLQVLTAPEAAKTAEVYKLLLAPARLHYTGNFARIAGNPSYLFFYTDETIDTAKLLLGHSKLKSDRAQARALSAGLINASEKSWYVTGTLLSVAQGLKAYAAAYDDVRVEGTAVIAIPELNKTAAVNWTQTQTGKLDTVWKEKRATIEITQHGSGSPYVTIQAASAVPLTASVAQGISVSKEMRNVTRTGSFKRGDVIEVTLKINANSTVQHVALMDPIPAGSNIMSEAYGAYDSGEKSYSGYKLYFSTLARGETTVKYQLQLNSPGSFKLPPTRAEGLYMPSVFGEAPNQTMSVE